MEASIRQLRADLVYCVAIFVGTASNMILSMKAFRSSSLPHSASARMPAASTPMENVHTRTCIACGGKYKGCDCLSIIFSGAAQGLQSVDRHSRTVAFAHSHVRSSLAYIFSGAAQGLQSRDRHSSRLVSVAHHNFVGAIIGGRGMQ